KESGGLHAPTEGIAFGGRGQTVAVSPLPNESLAPRRGIPGDRSVKRSSFHVAGDWGQGSGGRYCDEPTLRRRGRTGNSIEFSRRQADGGDSTALLATHHAQAPPASRWRGRRAMRYGHPEWGVIRGRYCRSDQGGAPEGV